MGITLAFAIATSALQLPPGLLSAVCYVESKHKVQAVNVNDGGSPSHGVCQIKLDTARLLGFKGTAKELMLPENNILFAGKYLKVQLTRYNNDVRKAVASYNTGTFRPDAEGRPKNKIYVSKVMKAWADNF